MEFWKQFELDCADYLNNKFGEYAEFIHQGGEDSKKSDIKVETKNHKIFYIEAKHCPAQCGQFVLSANFASKKFDYSRSDATPLNQNSKTIIEYMDENFEEYNNAGTTGKEIKFENCNTVFCNWIVDAYKHKKAEFFITNGYKILSVDDFPLFFNVTAKYRVKRSGSSPAGLPEMNNLKNFIAKNYNAAEFETSAKQLFVYSDDNLHGERFYYKNREYMLADRGGKYEVRKLANTFHANVIFSVELKNNLNGLTDAEFANLLLNF